MYHQVGGLLGGDKMPYDIPTATLLKSVQRHKVVLLGRRMTWRQHFFSTEDKNARYAIRVALLKHLGYF